MLLALLGRALRTRQPQTQFLSPAQELWVPPPFLRTLGRHCRQTYGLSVCPVLGSQLPTRPPGYLRFPIHSTTHTAGVGVCTSTVSSHCKAQESRLRQDSPRASGYGQPELNGPIAASLQLPLEPRRAYCWGGATRHQRIGSGRQETRLVVVTGLWPWRKM